MQNLLFAGVVSIAGLAAALAPSTAEAHGPRGGFSISIGGGGFGYPGYYGYGFHRYPSYGYYGGAGHDTLPHWHRSTSPYGTTYWYGQGAHDYYPHEHVVTPYSYRSYSYSPWGVTESIHSRYPRYYAPW